MSSDIKGPLDAGNQGSLQLTLEGVKVGGRGMLSKTYKGLWGSLLGIQEVMGRGEGEGELFPKPSNLHYARV